MLIDMKYKNLYILSVVFLFLVACSNQNKPTQTEITDVENTLPSIIEVISLNSDTILYDKFVEICNKYNIDSTSVYRWKNHLIVYDVLEDGEKMYEDMTNNYLGSMYSVKYYNKPYYIFDRQNCDNKETASEWSHTIMTANLVADTVMQKEYMDYHDTQAEKYPEVAKGFCNANFQQLLMFRNDRQLMLIISIPKGESLDELNPKTTENNPRVDEWNAIMSKFQEGIEGTQPEESWVILSPISK